MKFRIEEVGNKVIIKDVKNFVPKHIFECGQSFRWNEEEDGSYTGVAFNRVINVKKEKNDIVISNTTVTDFKEIWYNYFDLDRDYDDVKATLAKDPILKKATEFGHGIRILNQDPWETLISFIISTNRGIPVIKKSIEALSESYGEPLGTYGGKKHYSFPSAEKLDHLSVEEIKGCYTGYRARYIADSAVIVSEEQIHIDQVKNLSTEAARKALMSFPGVGRKVADCVMLFSMNKNDAFPIDVWVKRVMEYFYLKEDTKLEAIQSYAQEKFGDYTGFAQQYLFYYAREIGIGKSK